MLRWIQSFGFEASSGCAAAFAESDEGFQGCYPDKFAWNCAKKAPPSPACQISAILAMRIDEESRLCYEYYKQYKLREKDI